MFRFVLNGTETGRKKNSEKKKERKCVIERTMTTVSEEIREGCKSI